MDDFIHRLNMIPPQADSLLRQIRKLDKEVEDLQIRLYPLRELFLQQVVGWGDKRAIKARQEMDQDFRQIVRIENDIETKSKEKVSIAERLYNLIHQPTEKLDKEIMQRGLDKTYEDDGGLKKKRGKKPARKSLKRNEWEYDPNEPKYCYCGKPSYGEMVMCENTCCEREWFHVECLEEKKLP